MNAPGLSRREREQLRHRDEILEAASSVFAEKGFYNATMEDIAQKSEFAVGSLYKHFKSKEAIFIALFESRMSGFVDHIEAMVRDVPDFPAALDGFLESFAEFSDQNQALIRVFMGSQRTVDWHSEGIQVCIKPLMERYWHAIRELVATGSTRGHLISCDPDDLCAFVLGVLHSTFHATVHQGKEVDMKAKKPMIVKLLLHGMARRAPREAVELEA